MEKYISNPNLNKSDFWVEALGRVSPVIAAQSSRFQL
jgi:hypothetical protein